MIENYFIRLSNSLSFAIEISSLNLISFIINFEPNNNKVKSRLNSEFKTVLNTGELNKAKMIVQANRGKAPVNIQDILSGYLNGKQYSEEIIDYLESLKKESS